MGFCLSCGELANTSRCPKCKGKVSGASAAGLSNRDAWSATYLEKQNKKVHAPNLDKITRKKSFDATLPSLEAPASQNIEAQADTITSAPISRLSSSSSTQTLGSAVPDPCESCRLPLDNSPNNTIKTNNKKYHKGCLSCYMCSSKFEDTPIEINGQLSCKSCSVPQVASTTSSPTLDTPENELEESLSKEDDPQVMSPERQKTTSSIRPRLSFRNNMDSERRISQITESLQKLKAGPPRNSGGAQDSTSQGTTPLYSRTFQQLQATVNKNVGPSTSIRNRPRKTSESSAGLSFADLLASRRGQDSRMSTNSRRPVSMMGTETTNKRNSMLVGKDFSSAHSSSIDPSLPATRVNRLSSISRTRPTSMSFSDKKPSVSNIASSGGILGSQGKIPDGLRLTGRNAMSGQGIPSKPYEHKSPSPPREPITPLPEKKEETPLKDIPTVSSPTKLPDVPEDSSEKDSESSVSPPSIPTTPSVLSSKLTCSRCTKPIGDTWFKLPDGRVLHKECFQCNHCRNVIEDGKYSVYDDQEYHTDCLLQLPTSPMSDVYPEPEDVCDRCNQTIKGPCFTLTNGRQYHPNCFICAGCKKRFDQGTYVSQGDNEYHKECVPKRETICCGKCNEPIRGVFVTNNNMNFHSECFRCTGCNKVITPSTPFGEVAQQPYCEPCLIQQRTSRQSSFAVSAARQEQRRATTPSPFRS